MDREDDARKALKWLRPFPELVDAELAEMKAAIDAEKLLSVNSEIISGATQSIVVEHCLLLVPLLSKLLLVPCI